jgi:mannosyltransferase OCH1-like enzyme
VSKAENNYRAKKSKKPSQHTDKSNKQNWKNTLRQESIAEAQRRKASNNYAVKRIKLTNERIKNMISEQYNRFKSDHPSMKLTYEDYVERLIDMNLISDNENKILSKSIKD